MKTVELGRYGEILASHYLIACDFEIITTHFYSSFGEIDIIARKYDKIYFIEVKTRTNELFGDIFETVSKWQFQRVLKSGRFFALKHHLLEESLKIAFIGIVLNDFGGVKNINLIKDISLD